MCKHIHLYHWPGLALVQCPKTCRSYTMDMLCSIIFTCLYCVYPYHKFCFRIVWPLCPPGQCGHCVPFPLVLVGGQILVPQLDKSTLQVKDCCGVCFHYCLFIVQAQPQSPWTWRLPWWSCHSFYVIMTQWVTLNPHLPIWFWIDCLMEHTTEWMRALNIMMIGEHWVVSRLGIEVLQSVLDFML